MHRINSYFISFIAYLDLVTVNPTIQHFMAPVSLLKLWLFNDTYVTISSNFHANQHGKLPRCNDKILSISGYRRKMCNHLANLVN